MERLRFRSLEVTKIKKGQGVTATKRLHGKIHAPRRSCGESGVAAAASVNSPYEDLYLICAML